MPDNRNVDILTRDYPHRWFGIFGYEDTPLSHDFIDITWHPEDHEKMVAYLRGGLGFRPVEKAVLMPCEFCEHEFSLHEMKTDFEWVWTDYVIHLMEHHNLRLPNALVDHIRNHQYAHSDFSKISDDDYRRVPYPAFAKA